MKLNRRLSIDFLLLLLIDIVITVAPDCEITTPTCQHESANNTITAVAYLNDGEVGE
jgi:hypothetical protein